MGEGVGVGVGVGEGEGDDDDAERRPGEDWGPLAWSEGFSNEPRARGKEETWVPAWPAKARTPPATGPGRRQRSPCWRSLGQECSAVDPMLEQFSRACIGLCLTTGAVAWSPPCCALSGYPRTASGAAFLPSVQCIPQQRSEHWPGLAWPRW